jgi:hypothetical protein
MSEAYNVYQGLDSIPYKVIEHLFLNQEADIIWKLLKYNSSDAWSKPTLTPSEKAGLVYNGEEISTPYCVFRDSFSDDGTSEQKTFLRIYTHTIIPESRTTGIVNLCFEVYTHTKINHLSNYKQRVDMIIQALLKVFQDSEIGGAGSFYFNADRSYLNSIKIIASKFYQGKSLIMGVNMV